jgi:tetratricopeptide (TPR) repeat protein
MLEQHFRAQNVHVARPGDDVLPTRARLLTTAAPGETIRTFERRFDTSVRQQAEAVLQRARREAESGNLEAALGKYREAIQHEPTNWHLIGEAAAFIANGLRDYPCAIELAHTAVALNPWFSPWLWNVLGGALEDGGRSEHAHECYLQALRIHPSDVVTNLNLARSWLLQGNPGRCLEVVARGLAHDCEAMLRYRLLELQQRAIEALGTRWSREREVAARRSQQSCP